MRKVVIFFFAILLAVPSIACPICGCGVGGFYMGLMPSFDSKFIGLRYQYMRYQTHINDEPSQFSYDHYKTLELWGGWNIGSKWQVLAFVPYHFNYQNTDDGVKSEQGLGDISFIANYKLWQTSKQNKNDRSVSHQEFWLGAGFKLPTGSYNVDLTDPETEIGDVNSQMGTGSLDFISTLTYNITFGKIGINTSANYKINTANNSDFRFGNRLTASSVGFYQTRAGKTALTPNLGVLYENAATNRLQKEDIPQTGGYVALAVTGLEMRRGKVSFGANLQLPFAQDFASGQTKAETRGLLYANFSF